MFAPRMMSKRSLLQAVALRHLKRRRRHGKCRFIGFTGHHDPDIHNEMLRRYDKWDSTLMPLHAADNAYLSFQKNTLPHAVEQGIGIQAIKVFANAFLLRMLSVEECLRYALSLPISCAALGSNTRKPTQRECAHRPELQTVYARGDGAGRTTHLYLGHRRPARAGAGILETRRRLEVDHSFHFPEYRQTNSIPTAGVVSQSMMEPMTVKIGYIRTQSLTTTPGALMLSGNVYRKCNFQQIQVEAMLIAPDGFNMPCGRHKKKEMSHEECLKKAVHQEGKSSWRGRRCRIHQPASSELARHSE